MSFGSTVITFIGDLYPTDPIAPQTVADFTRALPPSPIRGEAVSDFARFEVRGGPPIQPVDLGISLSDYIALLRQVGGDGGGLGDGGLFG